MLLFWAEQINLMLFYYVQNVYQKNQLGARLDKRIRSYNTGEEAGRSRYILFYLHNDKITMLYSQTSINY